MSASIWAPGNNLVTIDAESTNLSQVFTATDSQVVFNLTLFSYAVGTGSIAVYRGGQRIILGTDWAETSSTSISLIGFTIAAGEIIEVVAVLGSASSASIAAAASAASAATSAAEAANSAASVDVASAITAERTAVATLTNKTLTSPTLTTPALGTPASGNLANCTFPTLNQNTSGTAAGLSATLVVGRGGTGLTTPGSSGNVLTSNGSAWISSPSASLTFGTNQASTSGTVVDFTGIPSTVKRITIFFEGVSTSGTSNIIVQLGNSGGYVASGYISTGNAIQGTNAGSNSFSTGFAQSNTDASSAAFTRYGSMVINRKDTSSTTYLYASSMTASGAASARIESGAGAVSVSNLDRVRITTVNGTDTFDGGSINIMYE